MAYPLLIFQCRSPKMRKKGGLPSRWLLFCLPLIIPNDPINVKLISRGTHFPQKKNTKNEEKSQGCHLCGWTHWIDLWSRRPPRRIHRIYTKLPYWSLPQFWAGGTPWCSLVLSVSSPTKGNGIGFLRNYASNCYYIYLMYLPFIYSSWTTYVHLPNTN